MIDSVSVLNADRPAAEAVQSCVSMMLRMADRLAVSADPEVVFGSLAELCVPVLGDSCVLSLVAPERSQLKISRMLPGDSSELVIEAQPVSEQRLSSNAILTPITLAAEEPSDGTSQPAGTLSLLFHRTTPTQAHALAAQLLVERASSIVSRERLQTRSNALVERTQNLEIALGSSREIGIALGVVMERYKLDSTNAFDLLRRISQRAHRKLRDVASEIAATGQIELPPQPSAAGTPKPAPPAVAATR